MADDFPPVGGTPQLDLDLDTRLLDVWRALWDSDELADHLTLVACFMRYAYGIGYWHALVEPVRASLYRDHGFRIPRRTQRNRWN